MAGVLGPEQRGMSEKAEVTVYQNTLAPAGRGGEKNDIYLSGPKVVLLGLDGNPSTSAEGGNEFTFTATYGPDARASTVAQSVLAPLAQALVRGVNGVVLLLGHTGSGKQELMRGGGVTSGAWDGLVERAVQEHAERGLSGLPQLAAPATGGWLARLPAALCTRAEPLRRSAGGCRAPWGGCGAAVRPG